MLSQSGGKKINPTVYAKPASGFGSNLFLVGLTLLLVVPLTFLLAGLGDKRTIQLMILGFPVIVLGFLNFRIALITFMITIFLDIYAMFFMSLAFLVIPYLLASFLVTNKGFRTKDLSTPFTKATILFILFMLPSLYNSMSRANSAINMMMWPGIILLVTMLAIAVKEKVETSFLVKVYVSIVSFNALYAIFQGITTGRRSYGFAGIMFVDILGIGIVIVFILLLHANGKKKLVYGALFAMLLVAMIFNKTRNVWLNVSLVMLLSFIHAIVHAANLQIDKKKLVRFGLITIFATIIIGGAFISIYGTKFLRLEEKQKLTSESLEVGDVSNSFVTRYFIWSTGYNALSVNPVFGMGMYSFAYTASNYNQLPVNLFKKYVLGYTLHHGYYSMLVETGIFGFTGFLIFLVMLFKRSRKIYLKAAGSEHFLHAFTGFWCLMYVITSLMFTDAWLWGRGIVMFGVILGTLAAIDSRINESAPVTLNE